MFKSGFVAIIGRPNVGKSSFMNYVLGQKVSIVSPKAQTTRNQITGIYTTKESQIIFLDTPGIHKPKNQLGKVMNDFSLNSLKDVDAIKNDRIYVVGLADLSPGVRNPMVIEKMYGYFYGENK